MTPPRPPPPAVSAPDLTGPSSILDWPRGAGGRSRHLPTRPFAHVHLEIDLEPEMVREPGLPVFRQMEALLREREVVEIGDLLRMAAGALHAFSAQGFRRVDHWETLPGGWLPLPEPTHASLIEPVGHLLHALQSAEWSRVANARSFSVRLSGSGPNRADLVLRRVHRERTHSLSIDLRGQVTRHQLRQLVSALRERLPVLRSQVTTYSHA